MEWLWAECLTSLSTSLGGHGVVRFGLGRAYECGNADDGGRNAPAGRCIGGGAQVVGELFGWVGKVHGEMLLVRAPKIDRW